MSIEIDKGIPMPVIRRKKLQYPFAEMKVGDSFLIVNNILIRNIKNYLCQRSVTRYGRFIASEVEGGIRVWRVE